MRRAVVAMILAMFAWAMLGAVATAGNYPPKPPAPQPIVAPPQRVAVVVKGVPSRPRAALGRTGTSSTVPLLALGVGSVVAGITLVGLSRRRRTAELLSDPA